MEPVSGGDERPATVRIALSDSETESSHAAARVSLTMSAHSRASSTSEGATSCASQLSSDSSDSTSDDGSDSRADESELRRRRQARMTMSSLAAMTPERERQHRRDKRRRAEGKVPPTKCCGLTLKDGPATKGKRKHRCRQNLMRVFLLLLAIGPLAATCVHHVLHRPEVQNSLPPSIKFLVMKSVVVCYGGIIQFGVSVLFAKLIKRYSPCGRRGYDDSEDLCVNAMRLAGTVFLMLVCFFLSKQIMESIPYPCHRWRYVVCKNRVYKVSNPVDEARELHFFGEEVDRGTEATRKGAEAATGNAAKMSITDIHEETGLSRITHAMLSPFESSWFGYSSEVYSELTQAEKSFFHAFGTGVGVHAHAYSHYHAIPRPHPGWESFRNLFGTSDDHLYLWLGDSSEPEYLQLTRAHSPPRKTLRSQC